jgi:hypothetical protein
MWDAAMTCGAQRVCQDSDGQCVAVTCDAAASPDWYSSPGGDPSLSDPRWNAASDRDFASSSAGGAGVYRMLLDRSATNPGELVVSLRGKLADSAGPGDKLFFGIAADGRSGHAVVMELAAAGPDSDPRAVPSLQRRDYTLSWSNQSGQPAWLKHANAWLTASGAASWAVNLRVDLNAAGISDVNAMRIALGLQIQLDAGNTVYSSTPSVSSFDSLVSSRPSNWPSVNAPADVCLPEVTLR